MRETDKKTKDKSKHKFRWSLLQRKSGQEKGGGGGRDRESSVESNNLSSFPPFSRVVYLPRGGGIHNPEVSSTLPPHSR